MHQYHRKLPMYMPQWLQLRKWYVISLLGFIKTSMLKFGLKFFQNLGKISKFGQGNQRTGSVVSKNPGESYNLYKLLCISNIFMIIGF